MSELEEYKRRVIAFENAARKKRVFFLIEMSLGAIKITGCKRHGKYST